MSEISNLIDKQVKELIENIPDKFYNKEGEPPEDENDRKVYFQFINTRAMFASSRPKTDELSSYEYRRTIEVLAIAAVRDQYKDQPCEIGKKICNFEAIREICANQLGNWYKVDKLIIKLKIANDNLEMYEKMDIPREWFKTASEYNRFKYHISHIDGLIIDYKELIKDYEKMIIELIQEENNVSSK